MEMCILGVILALLLGAGIGFYLSRKFKTV